MEPTYTATYSALEVKLESFILDLTVLYTLPAVNELVLFPDVEVLCNFLHESRALQMG